MLRLMLNLETEGEAKRRAGILLRLGFLPGDIQLLTGLPVRKIRQLVVKWEEETKYRRAELYGRSPLTPASIKGQTTRCPQCGCQAQLWGQMQKDDETIKVCYHCETQANTAALRSMRDEARAWGVDV